MIAPPPEGKPVAFYDTECFPNYWLLKIGVKSGPVFSFSLRAGQSFDPPTILRIDNLFQLFLMVSFNGIYYDVPMISSALAGFTPEQLKWLSDEITVTKKKPWELGLVSEWRPPDHVDIMEVLPGTGSQKQYAGRIHCKTMRDLPYPDTSWLSEEQIPIVDSYCENDLSVLSDLWDALEPQRLMRDHLSERYGMDLRSKSDAQLAEGVIKRRCEDALGSRIYKPEIDWNLAFRYEPPSWLGFVDERLKATLDLIKAAIFQLGASGAVVMPATLEGLQIPLGSTIYQIGIGGLHSKDKSAVYKSDETYLFRDCDVASYYPNLILMSGKYPPALGPVFREIYQLLIDERLEAKNLEKALNKAGDTESLKFKIAHVENEGGKVMVNGTFGKTGSLFSILFAPEMLIQTTVTGQLALLMLIEWCEMQKIGVVSANTDGLVVKIERSRLHILDNIVAYWEKSTGLKMETKDYKAIYARDVNNYFAVYTDEVTKKEGDPVKRKGEYSTAGLIEKKNPNVEICGDAVAKFLVSGVPPLYTIAACRDIRKFVTVRKVTGGAVKLWGEGPRGEIKVRGGIEPVLLANGWIKKGPRWTKDGVILLAREAYRKCFPPQMPEYLGKVIRWYYGSNSPGSVVYNESGNAVPLSYGARPCMVLPDEFPNDIDYSWYLQNCENMLKDVGYYGD